MGQFVVRLQGLEPRFWIRRVSTVVRDGESCSVLSASGCQAIAVRDERGSGLRMGSCAVAPEQDNITRQSTGSCGSMAAGNVLDGLNRSAITSGWGVVDER
jgi:hypothetical protein